MRSIKYLISALTLILFLSTNLVAQKESKEINEPMFWFGAYGGLNLNFHSSDFSRLPGFPCCSPLFESGNGIGFSGGLLFEYPFNESWLLDLRIGYATLDGKLNSDEIIGNTIENFYPNEISSKVTVEHYIDSRISGISFEPMAMYKFPFGLNASLGLRMAYLMSADFDQNEEIKDPPGVVFLEEMSRIRNKVDGAEIPERQDLQFMLAVGVGYDLEIGNKMYLTPEARFYLPFTNITRADSVNKWKVNTLQLGLALKIPVFPPTNKPVIEETIYLRDTNVISDMTIDEETITLIDKDSWTTTEDKGDHILKQKTIKESYEKIIKLVSKLACSLEAVGVKNDGTKEKNPTVVIEEIEAEEGFPLLTHVFFKKGNSDLRKTQMNLLSKGATADFKEDKLPWNTLDIYSDLLNITGLRMKNNPKAKLTLTGCNSNLDIEANNLKLSEDRAKAVKQYLTDVWGVEGSRISLKSRNLPAIPGNIEVKDGQQENQRVELSSNNYEIFKYLTLKEIIRTSNPPKVIIEPKVEAESDLRSWNLNINQQDKSIRDYSGKEMPSVIEWLVEEEPLPEMEEPVNIELKATDVLGQKTSSKEQLKIKQLTINKKRYELKDDKRIERYSLILFDFDKAKITADQQKILKDINDKIQPNSIVTIMGYTDRTGDKDYNRNLAMRRSQEVRKRLNVKPANLKIIPVGADVELYDNNFPEGRSYSRTVRVVIETPVE